MRLTAANLHGPINAPEGMLAQTPNRRRVPELFCCSLRQAPGAAQAVLVVTVRRTKWH